MTAFTYFNDSEVKHHRENLSHPLIRELIDELNEQTDGGWFVEERSRYAPQPRWKFWAEPTTRKVYSLYRNTHSVEYQCINFYVDGSDWSINITTSADKIIAYLYGYLGGLARAKSQ